MQIFSETLPGYKKFKFRVLGLMNSPILRCFDINSCDLMLISARLRTRLSKLRRNSSSSPRMFGGKFDG